MPLFAPSLAPRIITPPGAVVAGSGVAAWPAANQAIYMRFELARTGTYRYINLQVGVQSGNIQVGICSVALNDATTVLFSRLAHSGVIACPATGPQRIDLGATTLTPGDYLLFLWCDNTTATFMTTGTAGMAASRLLFASTSLVSGVPTSGTTGANTRWVSGLTLEAAS